MPFNAATVPLVRGKEYTLYHENIKNTAYTATFVPFTDDYTIGEGEDRMTNDYVEAHSDGFLVAVLKFKDNGDRCQVKLRQNKSRDNLDNDKLSVQATASIHKWSRTNTRIIMNTAFMPVMKDNFYRARYEATSGNPRIKLTWYSLTRNQAKK